MVVQRLFYKIATGPRRTRLLFTPIGLVVFLGLIGAVIGGGIFLDRMLGFGQLLPRVPSLIISIPLIAMGVVLSAWSILCFGRAKGTPVPFNPPRALVTKGPYAYVRNPMLTGMIMQLVGLAIIMRSVSMTVILMPALIAASVIELKLVEEPELEQRLGTSYADYKRVTPMFLPRLRRVSRNKRHLTPH